MSGRPIRLAATCAVAVLSGFAFGAPARAADVPTAVDAADIAALITPHPAVEDLRNGLRSPDGARIVFQREEHRQYVYAGTPDHPEDFVYPWQCHDNWVMRADGTALTRLTTSCDLGQTWAPGQGGAWWLADGSIVSTYASPVSHEGTGTTRWTLGASGASDVWQSSSFRGYVVATTTDLRYALVEDRRWLYSNTIWSAVDLKTGQVYRVWGEEHQGDGRWSDECSSAPEVSATGAPANAGHIAAAVTGSAPACTFARVVVPPRQDAPVATTPPPTDPVVTTPPAQTTQGETRATQQPATAAPENGPAPDAPRQTTTTPPALTIDAVTTRRDLVIKRGLAVKFSTAKPGALKVWLLGAEGATLARYSATVGSGNAAAKLLLGRSAAKLLRKTDRVTVRVSLTAADGSRRVVERTVAFPG